MDSIKNYLYELLGRLSFVRFGGTEDEYRAAQLLQSEMKAFGGTSELFPFEIPAYTIEHCRMSVNGEKIDCAAMGHSGEFPEGGVTLPLIYVENMEAVKILEDDQVKGCAVLTNFISLDFYKEMVNRGAAALIDIDTSKWYEEKELISWEMRPPYLRAGQIPSFTIRAIDAIRILKNDADRIHIELRQHSYTNTSHDILATIEGTEQRHEDVILTAHYDSASVSPGAYDNGSGAVVLMYIYQHYLKNPPKRTMRFIWCGSEEQGLLGSKAYVEAHREQLKSARLCYNLDSCGTVLGENNIDIAGSEELLKLTETICKEYKFPCSIDLYPDSSDSANFADCGIPSVCPGRGHWTSSECHTRMDRIDTISSEKLYEMGQFSVFYLDHFVNAETFPVPREMPEDMVQQLNSMFYRDNSNS